MNTDSQWSKRKSCFAHVTQVLLAGNYNTSVTSGVRSVLNGQVSLAAVNQVYDIHGAMNGCEILTIH